MEIGDFEFYQEPKIIRHKTNGDEIEQGKTKSNGCIVSLSAIKINHSY